MPPIVIAGAVAAAGAVGGALISSSSQKHAAEQATNATVNAQNTATQAQLQLGQQSLDQQRQMYNNNIGLQTDIYNQNFGMLSPYATNGMVASNAVNALLNLPSASPIQSTVHAPAPIAPQTLPAPNALGGFTGAAPLGARGAYGPVGAFLGAVN